MVDSFGVYLNLRLKYDLRSLLIGVIDHPNSDIIQSYISNLDCSKENIEKFRRDIQRYNKVSWIDEIEVKIKRSGLGSELIRKFENFSIIEGSEVIFCEPDLDSEIGFDNLVEFYKKQGFEYNKELILNKKNLVY